MSTTTELSSTDTAILNAVKAGAQRTGQIATATGLNTELLDTPLKRLRRSGLLTFLKGSGPGTGWQPTAIAAIDDAAVKPAAAAVDTTAKKAASKRAAKKAKPVERFDVQLTPRPLPANESQEAVLAEEPAVQTTPLGSVKSTGKARKKDKPVPPPAEPAADDSTASTEGNAAEGPADYMLFIGSNFYGKEEFIREASELGISRRMPSHRLPAGLVCGQSRVFVAVGGARKAGEGEDAMSTSEVFGYFIPQRVEFIASTDGGDGTQYADIIALVNARRDSRIITTVQGEGLRGCGFRKEGGTYIVVDKADSPLHLLAKPATYVGNHFRGVMKLPTDAAQTFSEGGTYATLIDEVCMVPTCDVQGGRKFKCAPDGHIRATRERKRMERGEDAKWCLACGECRRKAMAAKAAERKAAKGDAPVAAKVNPENPQPEGSVLADETQFNGDN